jgi:hypothetical protein
MADSATEYNAVDSSNPLLDSALLRTVLSYVGPGQHLFVALVSKWWRDVISNWWKEAHGMLKCRKLAVRDEKHRRHMLTCASQMTLYSSVFTSPSRVQHAHYNGLNCTSEAYQLAAGRHADVATLATAHELGMEFTETLMACAAHCNKLAEVQYLHSHGCPWSAYLLETAASSGHFELVRWCHEQGCPWYANVIARCAAESGNIELMAWVLQQPGTSLSKGVLCAAAKKGHSAMCQFLHSQQHL